MLVAVSIFGSHRVSVARRTPLVAERLDSKLASSFLHCGTVSEPNGENNQGREVNHVTFENKSCFVRGGNHIHSGLAFVWGLHSDTIR
jgi:hypothetical protein